MDKKLLYNVREIVTHLCKAAGGNIMGKRIDLSIWKIVSVLALAFTTVAANTTCMFQYYQPSMPKGSEKLKRK